MKKFAVGGQRNFGTLSDEQGYSVPNVEGFGSALFDPAQLGESVNGLSAALAAFSTTHSTASQARTASSDDAVVPKNLRSTDRPKADDSHSSDSGASSNGKSAWTPPQREAVFESDDREGWKGKYQTLKKEFDVFKLEHQRIVGEKNSEISNLKRQLASASKADASREIAALNDEIQKILEQKISMETEIGQLRFDLKNKTFGTSTTTDDHSAVRANVSDFELERQMNVLRSQLNEKDATVQRIEGKLTEANGEIERLTKLLGHVHHDIAELEDRKAKKKTWWGGKKKGSRRDELSVTAADLGDQLGYESSGDESRKSTKRKDKRDVEHGAISGAAVSRLKTQHAEGLEDLQRKLGDLKIENARQGGEIEILERERRAFESKLQRVEAHNDLLKSQQAAATTSQALTVARNVAIPLPEEGGSELDRLRVVVQLQTGALSQLAAQKKQIEDLLNHYEKDHSTFDDRRDTKEATLQEDIRRGALEVSELRKKNSKLEARLREVTIQLAAVEDHLTRTKVSLIDLSKSTAQAAELNKKQKIEYAVLVGNTLHENEGLVSELSRLKDLRTKEMSQHAAESRVLQEGRVRRLDGDHPMAPTFPSGQGKLNLRVKRSVLPEEKSKTVNTSTVVALEEKSQPPRQTSSDRPAPPSASTRRSSSTPKRSSDRGEYAYRWTGSGYVLEETAPAVRIPPNAGVGSEVPCGACRPIVTVQPFGNGGLPVIARTSPTLSATIVDSLEPSKEDQERAERALKEWNASPPAQTPTYAQQPRSINRGNVPRGRDVSPFDPRRVPRRQFSSSSDDRRPPPRQHSAGRPAVRRVAIAAGSPAESSASSEFAVRVDNRSAVTATATFGHPSKVSSSSSSVKLRNAKETRRGSFAISSPSTDKSIDDEPAMAEIDRRLAELKPGVVVGDLT